MSELFEVVVSRGITTYVMAENRTAAIAFADSAEWGSDSDFGSERDVYAYPVTCPAEESDYIWDGKEWRPWDNSDA